MARNQYHDGKRIKSWSDLNDDVVYLVMMRLGVIDFVAFSGVCKSWRSLAHSNINMFMATKPPMPLTISSTDDDVEKKSYLHLKDLEGRRFKTLIPHSGGRDFVGLTCGYLILFGKKTHDFWLVNPITGHQLHFPDFPDDVPFDLNTLSLYSGIMAILVFSPSGWLFGITERLHEYIWFSTTAAGSKGVWNHISTPPLILGLHVVKGKIYTLNFGGPGKVEYLCEISLGPDPKLMSLKTNKFPQTYCLPKFLHWSENLFLVEFIPDDLDKVHELDFGEMEWVCHEKTKEEYALYANHREHVMAVKRELCYDKSQKDWFNYAHMWYFPHESLNVISLINECD